MENGGEYFKMKFVGRRDVDVMSNTLLICVNGVSFSHVYLNDNFLSLNFNIGLMNSPSTNVV